MVFRHGSFSTLTIRLSYDEWTLPTPFKWNPGPEEPSGQRTDGVEEFE